MKIVNFFLFILFIPVLSISCQVQSDSQKQEAGNYPGSIVSIYLVTQLNGLDLDVKSNYNRNITIEFQSEANRMMGFSGCNRFSGSYKYSEGNFAIAKPLISTRMACADKNNEQEFYSAIEQVTFVESHERGIKFLDKSKKTVMILKKIDE